MGNPVVHFEITAKNIERLHAFYSKVFGWKIVSGALIPPCRLSWPAITMPAES